jgi:hypothetical protein
MFFDSSETAIDEIVPNARQTALDSELRGARGKGVFIARSSALLGMLILFFSIAEIVTVAFLPEALILHIAIGSILGVLIIVKLILNAYRYLGYLKHDHDFRQAGTPRLIMRILSLPLVVTTIVVLGTGMAMVLTGPTAFATSFLATAHALFAIIWLGLLGYHTFGYWHRSARSTTRELDRIRSKDTQALARLILAATTVIGAVTLMLLLLPLSNRWRFTDLHNSRVAKAPSYIPVWYSKSSLAEGRRRLAQHLKEMEALRKRSQ